MSDETIGLKPKEQPKLAVTKIKDSYGEGYMVEFKFYYDSGDHTTFRVADEMYELMKDHYKNNNPRITVK